MPYICGKCGAVSVCKLATILHTLTTHYHQDVWINPDMDDEENGVNCLTCLLNRMIPIEDYWRLLGVNLRKGGER